jgi:hypothetical protein
MATANLQTLARPSTLEDHLAKARHAAAIGDGPHTILHAQQAVCVAVTALGEDIAALRSELARRGG